MARLIIVYLINRKQSQRNCFASAFEGVGGELALENHQIIKRDEERAKFYIEEQRRYL